MLINAVAPFAGAWIEIIITDSAQPQRVGVAPFAGAWIEIVKLYTQTLPPPVAPFAGAWIEIKAIRVFNDFKYSRSLRGSVD